MGSRKTLPEMPPGGSLSGSVHENAIRANAKAKESGNLSEITAQYYSINH